MALCHIPPELREPILLPMKNTVPLFCFLRQVWLNAPRKIHILEVAMPIRASRTVILLGVLFSSGCAVWPGEEHRAVTMDSIRAAVDDSLRSQPQQPAASCLDLTGVEEQLRRQRSQMVKMNKQLQALTSASPAFASADCPPVNAPASAVDGKTIIGDSEWIYLTPPGHHYQARVDSGAALSSLSAINITRFERNGEKWVRFWLQHDDEADPIEVEAPLVRHVRIRQASADEADRRPVVSLTVNLGNNLQQNAEFSLTDRSQMTYPILLGREFLRDVTLIDVGRQFVQPKFVPDMPQQPASVKAPAELSPTGPSPAEPAAAEHEPAPQTPAAAATPDSDTGSIAPESAATPASAVSE